MTWDELTERLKDRNENAFRQLVEENMDRIVNTCYGFVKDRQDAEDIAQNVFIQAYKSISSFRGDSKLSTWLYRIAVNQSLNFIKSSKRKNIFQSLESPFGGSKRDIASKQDTSSEKMEKDEQIELLHTMIGKLPENQRIALTLNKFEDLSYQEVADIMDISVPAVTSLINRGKENLKKKIEKFYKKK